MTKQEFLERLGELLSCLPDDKIAESKAFYAEAIADRMEDGATEDEAVAALGSPGVVAEAILDELPAVPRAVAKTRRKSRTLLWVLAIAGSPVWLVLALAFVIVVAAVYVCIWALVVCIWVLAAALVVGCPAAALFAYWGFAAGNAPFGVAYIGAGLALLGLGMFCLGGAVAATKQLTKLSHYWGRKALSPFKKADAPANAPVAAAA
ncbi:MAG: DUF1700 domain-containing protein [Eggerthellaceae bacterium]|nr:DUF1700 domain-containing protein [Eggerthellaceae bacterium]